MHTRCRPGAGKKHEPAGDAGHARDNGGLLVGVAAKVGCERQIEYCAPADGSARAEPPTPWRQAGFADAGVLRRCAAHTTPATTPQACCACVAAYIALTIRTCIKPQRQRVSYGKKLKILFKAF